MAINERRHNGVCNRRDLNYGRDLPQVPSVLNVFQCPLWKDLLKPAVSFWVICNGMDVFNRRVEIYRSNRHELGVAER